MENLTLLVTFVALVAIFLLFMGDLRGGSRPARSLKDLERYGGDESWNGLFAGLLSAIAAGSATNTAGLDWGAGVTAGVMVGIVFAIISISKLTLLRTWVSGIFGAIGLSAITIGLFAQVGCFEIPLWERLITLILVLGAGAAGFLLRVLRGRWPRMTLLSIFGALKIALFFSAPLGVALFDLPWYGWVIGFGSALVFGFLASYGPNVSIALATASIAVFSLASSTVVGDSCVAGPRFADLGPLIGFGVAYALVWLMLGRVLRR